MMLCGEKPLTGEWFPFMGALLLSQAAAAGWTISFVQGNTVMLGIFSLIENKIFKEFSQDFAFCDFWVHEFWGAFYVVKPQNSSKDFQNSTFSANLHQIFYQFLQNCFYDFSTSNSPKQCLKIITNFEITKCEGPLYIHFVFQDSPNYSVDI